MLVDVDADEYPPLVVPHAQKCRDHDHPDTHCYRERELEDRFIEDLAPYRRLQVQRQPSWRGVGIPDVVTWYTFPRVKYLTVFELKVVPIDRHALAQLTRYIEAYEQWAERQEDDYAISGVLVGFYLRPIALPSWVSFRQVLIEDAA
jgi:hypothetical protein